MSTQIPQRSLTDNNRGPNWTSYWRPEEKVRPEDYDCLCEHDSITQCVGFDCLTVVDTRVVDTKVVDTKVVDTKVAK